jgi:hypothetical protein
MFRFPIALLLFLGGCVLQQDTSQVERIEINQSGEEALVIAVSRDGHSSFERIGTTPPNWTGPPPPNTRGTFHLNANEFHALERQLSEFQGKAVPRTDASLRAIMDWRCPEGTPFTYDLGAIYVRWMGAKSDVHYWADLGCDKIRMRSRNAKLFAAIQSLPIPPR